MNAPVCQFEERELLKMKELGKTVAILIKHEHYLYNILKTHYYPITVVLGYKQKDTQILHLLYMIQISVQNKFIDQIARKNEINFCILKNVSALSNLIKRCICVCVCVCSECISALLNFFHSPFLHPHLERKVFPYPRQQPCKCDLLQPMAGKRKQQCARFLFLPWEYFIDSIYILVPLNIYAASYEPEQSVTEHQSDNS